MLWLVVLVVLLGGCTQEGPAPEALPAPPEDLSHFRVSTLVQPVKRLAPLPVALEHKPTPAEKVYDYQPGGTYAVPVTVGVPLDLLLERGEELRNVVLGDPKPVEEGKPAPWAWKDGASGKDATMQPHIFLYAYEPGLKMGAIVTTTRRVYYLTCDSVSKSPIRAVRWRYSDVVLDVAPEKEPALLPHPDEPRKYHVGYMVTTTQPPPAFIPRHIVDDGEKLYLVYPEIILWKTVPLVREIGVQGPQILNSRQYLNVVIIDTLPAKLELRVGVEKQAQTVTITQGVLRTIDCPGHPECPVWPAAAQQVAERERRTN